MTVQPFSDEQSRVIVNLEQAYQVWMDSLRVLNDLPYNMRVKEVSGREYLYEVTDRLGNMKSKGPLDPEKQPEFDQYKAEKAELKEAVAAWLYRSTASLSCAARTRAAPSAASVSMSVKPGVRPPCSGPSHNPISATVR